MAREFTIPRTGQAYGLVVVVTVLMLLAGLLVPLVFGRPDSDVELSASDPFTQGSGDANEGEVEDPLEPEGESAPAPQDEPTPVPEDGSTPAPEDERAPVPEGESTRAPEGEAPEGEGEDPSTDASLTASDVGVTASTIKVGVVYLDLEAVAPLGLEIQNFDVETQRRSFQAYFDEINEAGGINGRRIEAVYVRNDPLDAGAARSRCVKLATDEQVFAVLGWVTDEAACLTQEFQIPTFAYRNYQQDVYAKSDNYLVSSLPSLERTTMNWAGALDQLNALQGRTLGIVAGEQAEEKAPADALEATLGQLGHEVAYRARMSANESTAMSQLPIEVQRMRDAGVDTVLMPTNFVSARSWVENAQDQQWAPQYHVSDVGQLTSEPLVERMPDSFDGAIGITNFGYGIAAARTGEPEPDETRACRETYNRRADGEDVDEGEVHPINNSCPLVRIFQPAVTEAGAELTRGGTIAAVQSLGRLALPTYAGGSFAAGKTDYNDDVRPLRWQASCRCYEVTGQSIPGRF